MEKKYNKFWIKRKIYYISGRINSLQNNDRCSKCCSKISPDINKYEHLKMLKNHYENELNKIKLYKNE